MFRVQNSRRERSVRQVAVFPFRKINLERLQNARQIIRAIGKVFQVLMQLLDAECEPEDLTDELIGKLSKYPVQRNPVKLMQSAYFLFALFNRWCLQLCCDCIAAASRNVVIADPVAAVTSETDNRMNSGSGSLVARPIIAKSLRRRRRALHIGSGSGQAARYVALFSLNFIRDGFCPADRLPYLVMKILDRLRIARFRHALHQNRCKRRHSGKGRGRLLQ